MCQVLEVCYWSFLYYNGQSYTWMALSSDTETTLDPFPLYFDCQTWKVKKGKKILKYILLEWF